MQFKNLWETYQWIPGFPEDLWNGGYPGMARDLYLWPWDFTPPQAEQQLPSQSVGKDFGKAKGRQTHDGMKTGASWCHWSKGRSWCGSNLNKTGWTSQLILQMRVFTTRVCWDFSATSVFFSSISPSKFSQHFPDIFQNNYPWFSRFSQHLPRFYRFSCTFVLDFPTIFLQGGAPPTINGL